MPVEEMVLCVRGSRLPHVVLGKGRLGLFRAAGLCRWYRLERRALMFLPDKGSAPDVRNVLGVVIFRRYYEPVELFGLALNLIDGVVRGIVNASGSVV